LADAINVYHTNPKIYYVPDDPRLGRYGDEIGGEIISGDIISGQRISEVGKTYVIDFTSLNEDDFSLGESVSIVVIMNDSDIVLTTFETKTG
jgi:hypothetical protein